MEKFALEFLELKSEIIQNMELAIPFFGTKSLKNKAKRMIETDFM